MRARISKILIGKLKNKPSKVYRNFELQVLLQITAKAFDVKSKCILFSRNPLEEYMLFSKRAMDRTVDLDSVFAISYDFGKKLKAFTGLAETEDLMELVYLLYQYIGITMTGRLPEEFLVQGCYFSRFYGADACQKMSAMDSGIIAGIYYEQMPNARLAFSERITEGCSVCKARFR